MQPGWAADAPVREISSRESNLIESILPVASGIGTRDHTVPRSILRSPSRFFGGFRLLFDPGNIDHPVALTEVDQPDALGVPSNRAHTAHWQSNQDPVL